MEEYYNSMLTIETKRLLLRPLEENDAEAIYHNINHDKKVLEYFIAPYIEDIKDASVKNMRAYYKETKKYCFAIVLKESNTVIGMILQTNDLSATSHTVEVGYAIGSSYWNNGYVSEALEAVIKLLFDRGVHKVTCGYITENDASKRVMEKCGMIYEGIKKDEIYYHDVEYYYLINPKDTKINP